MTSFGVLKDHQGQLLYVQKKLKQEFGDYTSRKVSLILGIDKVSLIKREIDMEKYFVGSWQITNQTTGITFNRKELCRSLVTLNSSHGNIFLNSIKIDHPDSVVKQIRLKELS